MNGLSFRAHDSAAEILHDERMRFCANAYEAATGADAVVVLTEWNEFRNFDPAALKRVTKGSVLLDARNVFNSDSAFAKGLVYLGRGRGPEAVVQSPALNPGGSSAT